MDAARVKHRPRDANLESRCYLIPDRDPLRTEAFRKMLSDNGTEALKLPARSPYPSATMTANAITKGLAAT
jgi:hypothetical protein